MTDSQQINWQEKLGCSILTRREASALVSRMEDFYVYLLWKMYGDEPLPFYVGKGHKDRIIKHESPSEIQNLHKVNIIKKHKKFSIDVGYSILSWHKLEEDAFRKEVELISNIGRADLFQGSLTNKTDGGDGTRGHLAPKRGDVHNARVIYAVVDNLCTRFACIEDCAEKLGVEGGTVTARIRNGWPGYYYEDEGQQPLCKDFRGKYRRLVHTPEGNFESLSDAARQLGISFKQIHKWISRGWEGYYYQDEGQRPRCRPEKTLKIAGVIFVSHKEAASVLGMQKSAIAVRLKSSNYPDWVDLTGTIKKFDKKQPVVHIRVDGELFNSIADAERAIGISQDTLAARAKSSNYPNVIIEGVNKQTRSANLAKLAVSVSIDGILYKTLSDASRSVGLDISTLKRRCCSPSFSNYSSSDPSLHKRAFKDGRPSLCKIIVNGISYRSINDASQTTGIWRGKLKKMALDDSISDVYFES